MTGGPCAGKTTAMDLVREKLEPTYKVLVVPELATITILGGYDMQTHKSTEQVYQFLVRLEDNLRKHLEISKWQMRTSSSSWLR